jgi:hypothetical protein
MRCDRGIDGMEERLRFCGRHGIALRANASIPVVAGAATLTKASPGPRFRPSLSVARLVMNSEALRVCTVRGFPCFLGLARAEGWRRVSFESSLSGRRGFRVSTFALAESKRKPLRLLLSGWRLKRPLFSFENSRPVTLEVAGSSPVAPAIESSS